MKDSERWDNRAKAHYHQWKSFEFELNSYEYAHGSDSLFRDMISTYKQLEEKAKKQAKQCREWEAWQK